MRELVGILAVGAFSCLGCSPAVEDADAPEISYCDAQPILADKCLRCHSVPLMNGAPLSLETYELVEEVQVRVKNALSLEGFMPAVWVDDEPPVEDLTEEERELLIAWLDDGAPRGEGCE